MSQEGQHKRESKAGSAQGEREFVLVKNGQAQEDWGLEVKEKAMPKWAGRVKW
jgi:hypothetical protein